MEDIEIIPVQHNFKEKKTNKNESIFFCSSSFFLFAYGGDPQNVCNFVFGSNVFAKPKSKRNAVMQISCRLSLPATLIFPCSSNSKFSAFKSPRKNNKMSTFAFFFSLFVRTMNLNKIVKEN